MPKGRPVRIAREQLGGIEPGSYGRKTTLRGGSTASWASHMGAAHAGAKEVMVKITGGGRSADGVQAHFEYLDRHGELALETDAGEILKGKQAATELINEWALDYGKVPGAPHSRSARKSDGEKKPPRQAFNIVLSMPAGTPPQKVLQAAKKFARERFAHQHRYVMALHSEETETDAKRKAHGKHPHVHLVVKAEPEYGGARLNPRKSDLRDWREQFARYLNELGVAATATRREDRGLTKTHKKTAVYRAAERNPETRERKARPEPERYTEAGDSQFMRKKLEVVKRELAQQGTVADREAYGALLNVRAQVTARYTEAIAWLRSQGREAEARRFELMQRTLPPVRTENQLIAEAILAQRAVLHRPDPDRTRVR